MRTWIIIALVVLIVLLGGIWAYLLINGTPEGIAELRNDLFGKNSIAVTAPPQAPVIPSVTDDGGERRIATDAPLVQISERVVAGAVITDIASSTLIRYMEKGTGHIYEVDIATGVENRISNTTIPGTVRAIWAPTGNRLVIETDQGGVQGDTFLGTLSAGSTTVFDTEKLTSGLGNIAFSQSGSVLFYTALGSNGGTAGYARDLTAGTVREVWNTSFNELTALWDIWDQSTHYVFTKPALNYQSYLYAIDGTSLKKIDEGPMLTAVRPQDTVLLSSKDNGGQPITLLLNTQSGSGSLLTLRAVKEKCAGEMLWCAVATGQSGSMVSWYQGTVSFEDKLYRIDRDGDVIVEVSLTEQAREPIDATEVMVGRDGRIILKNKRDDTLWLVNTNR